jgi:hypothetical protein
MKLGNAATAKVRMIVWYKACGHHVEPTPLSTLDDTVPR